MKKIWIIMTMVMLAVTMVLYGVGCTAEEAAEDINEEEVGETVAEEPAEEPEEEAAGEPAEEVTINVLFGETEDWHVPEAQIDEFYAMHPNIKVNFTFLSQKEMTEKTRLELASGSSTYDIVYFDDQLSPAYVSAGWLAPLDSYIERDADEVDKDDFFPTAYNSGIENGSLYGLPFYQEAIILYFNSEMFEKYGVDPPATLDEWMEAAAKLTVKDDSGRQLYGTTMRGFKGPGSVTYTVTAFLRAFGTDWLDENYKPVFNNEAGKEAITWYRDILLDYAPPGVSTFKWNECLASFQQGESAMFADSSVFGTWMQDEEQSAIVGKVGYIALPAGPEGSIPSSYVAMHGINSVSENKDAAWEFLKWMNGKTIDPLISTPSRLSSYEIDSVKEKFNIGIEGYKYDDALAAGLETAERPFPAIAEWNEVSSIVSEAIEMILIGEDVDESFDNAAEQVEALLEGAGYYE
ncbi:MAG: sugar ABC transporter substrate-binding protein [Actinobacteria bacterium]|nr:sugar ABC transporter substrate-binding protein [Actinomycetota bacterium]